MNCQKCDSPRVASINAKCSDMCFVNLLDQEHDGYVPEDLGVGGGDYVEFDVCLACGHVQGEWPLPTTKLERDHMKNKQFQERLANWSPPARDGRYEDYLNNLVHECHNKGYKGIHGVLPMLLGEDYDADRIIAGVQELHRYPEFKSLTNTIMDKMESWEHYDRMCEAVALVVPPALNDDEDEDLD